MLLINWQSKTDGQSSEFRGASAEKLAEIGEKLAVEIPMIFGRPFDYTLLHDQVVLENRFTGKTYVLVEKKRNIPSLIYTRSVQTSKLYFICLICSILAVCPVPSNRRLCYDYMVISNTLMSNLKFLNWPNIRKIHQWKCVGVFLVWLAFRQCNFGKSKCGSHLTLSSNMAGCKLSSFFLFYSSWKLNEAIKI